MAFATDRTQIITTASGAGTAVGTQVYAFFAESATVFTHGFGTGLTFVAHFTEYHGTFAAFAAVRTVFTCAGDTGRTDWALLHTHRTDFCAFGTELFAFPTYIAL